MPSTDQWGLGEASCGTIKKRVIMSLMSTKPRVYTLPHRLLKKLRQSTFQYAQSMSEKHPSAKMVNTPKFNAKVCAFLDKDKIRRNCEREFVKMKAATYLCELETYANIGNIGVSNAHTVGSCTIRHCHHGVWNFAALRIAAKVLRNEGYDVRIVRGMRGSCPSEVLSTSPDEYMYGMDHVANIDEMWRTDQRWAYLLDANEVL